MALGISFWDSSLLRRGLYRISTALLGLFFYRTFFSIFLISYSFSTERSLYEGESMDSKVKTIDYEQSFFSYRDSQEKQTREQARRSPAALSMTRVSSR